MIEMLSCGCLYDIHNDHKKLYRILDHIFINKNNTINEWVNFL